MATAAFDELMGITEAKAELGKRLRRLASGELERVVILNRSNPVAVILTVDEYSRLQEVEKMREEFEDVLAAMKAKAADDGTRISLNELETRLSQI